MGLMDFLKNKGEEKPAENNPNAGLNADANQQGQHDTYTVKSGDSLSKIAKQYYGDAMQWPKIFEANKDQIQDPDLIHPGQTFKIPKQ